MPSSRSLLVLTNETSFFVFCSINLMNVYASFGRSPKSLASCVGFCQPLRMSNSGSHRPNSLILAGSRPLIFSITSGVSGSPSTRFWYAVQTLIFSSSSRRSRWVKNRELIVLSLSAWLTRFRSVHPSSKLSSGRR